MKNKFLSVGGEKKRAKQEEQNYDAKMPIYRVEIEVQYSRLCTAMNPSLVPSLDTEWLRTTCNASSRGFNTVFWPPKTLRIISRK